MSAGGSFCPRKAYAKRGKVFSDRKNVLETLFPFSPPSPRTLSVMPDLIGHLLPAISIIPCQVCQKMFHLPGIRPFSRQVGIKNAHLTGSEVVRQVGTSLGSGRGRTGLPCLAREASRPAGAGNRILRRRCHPRQTSWLRFSLVLQINPEIFAVVPHN